jgi:gamma-glutamyltranspeptidase / glutathione hydrolase
MQLYLKVGVSNFAFLLFSGCVTVKEDFRQKPYFSNYSTQQRVISSHGGVTTAHPLASKVGVCILQSGGNAIDAAIAVQFALAVVFPQAGNIGGGGFMVMRLSNGETKSLDFREKAPLSAHEHMYIDSAGNLEQHKSLAGHLASGIPGTMAGIEESLKYARLPLKKLIQPAIDLAEYGYVITPGIADEIPGTDSSLNTRPNIFDGAIQWKVGDTLRQPDLAKTLRRIRDKGCREFYLGETANLIVEEMKRGGGMITHDDLTNYSAKWRKPHAFEYRGYEIFSMPLPSSGGIILNQLLKIIEPYDVATWGFGSARTISLMVEAERVAYRNRALYLGDADFESIPLTKLTSKAYLENEMQDFNFEKARLSQPLPGLNLQPESNETTHFSIVDKYGNAVAVTTTLNMPYGSQVVVGGAGFFLNNEMNDFSVKPGTPNSSGGIGGFNNSIKPGKRMLSSMTPTIVVKDNKVFMVVGSPGGTTIPTSVFQSIINVIDFNMSAINAVNSPKFHHEWVPDVVKFEKGFEMSQLDKITEMGYFWQGNNASLGRVEMILNRKENWEIVSDMRGGKDCAEGY